MREGEGEREGEGRVQRGRHGGQEERDILEVLRGGQKGKKRDR